MKWDGNTFLSRYREIIFQLVLHLLVFLFYSFDKREPRIEFHQLAFFANYAIAAALINYLFLPQFLYKKKYLHFLLFASLTIIGVMVMEELVLEQIYFPDTRGRSFPGFFFTLLGILPVIVILVGVKFGWDALEKQKEVESLRVAVKESQLQFLSSQINPHFLFNNLNNLYAYAIEQSPRTPEIILELSSVLRYMLYATRERYVRLGQELEQLEQFIRLSELQIEGRGEVSYEFSGQGSDLRIAPLILIVFIENAFKHSQSSMAQNIHIDTGVKIVENGTLKFWCHNSYGEETNTEDLSRGIGLENVKKRLALLYPDLHTLSIEKSEGEYKVELLLTLRATS